LKMPVCELELDYGRRPDGSHSKLSTFGDGRKILWMFAMLMKETRPFAFYLMFAAALFAGGVTLSLPVLYEFFSTGLVTRMPTWILAVTMVGMSFGMFMAGLILDSLARTRVEQLRIHYLGQPGIVRTPMPSMPMAATRKSGGNPIKTKAA
jgi:MFS family permease